MNNMIEEKLCQIESENEIKILYACESGSRAWGFPSPNSDYDVRFIYVQHLDWHLSLKDNKDSIELPINKDLDIGGWEIKKAIGLLWRSNPPLLEWLQSSIVYQANNNFLRDVRALSQDYFSPIAVMHHYLSMSKKYFDACQGNDEVKLKKYFYALRTAIAGKWVRVKMTMPYTDMSNMFEVVEQKVQNKIIQLIEVKSQQNEDYLQIREPLIDKFLHETIEQNEAVADNLPSGSGDFEKLDDLYRSIVKGKYT